jgi:uncharacterized membrane protein
MPFIDFARGAVMIIMAWDHVSSFWHQLHHGGEGILGRAPPFESLGWFLERFVSHWCAPTFIFLAGASLALSAAKRLERGDSQGEITFHIIKRGLVLLLFEALLVSPAFDLPPYYFGVIACIGVGLIIFSVSRRLPTTIILVLSLFIVLNHSFLDLSWIPDTYPWGWYLRVIIHEPNFDGWPYVGLYPLIPWIGVMGLGWCFGSVLPRFERNQIGKLKNSLFFTGLASIALFFAVRWMNGFGNLLLRQGDTLIDWLYVSKYPPSVAFLLWSLGGMCVFLAVGLVLQEKPRIGNRLTDAIHDIGKAPLFFYLAHLWLYRLRLPGVGEPPFYLEMYQTFVFWIVGLVVLWQFTKWFYLYKRARPGSLLRYV